ncbi:hypothetical protein ACWCP6_20385 [Streptomyces sp. NPDC002004]
MNRTPVILRPLLAAAALVIGILTMAGSLPLASRLTGLLSYVLGPTPSQIVLLLAGVLAFGITLHRSLRPLRVTADATDR